MVNVPNLSTQCFTHSKWCRMVSINNTLQSLAPTFRKLLTNNNFLGLVDMDQEAIFLNRRSSQRIIRRSLFHLHLRSDQGDFRVLVTGLTFSCCFVSEFQGEILKSQIITTCSAFEYEESLHQGISSFFLNHLNQLP